MTDIAIIAIMLALCVLSAKAMASGDRRLPHGGSLPHARLVSDLVDPSRYDPSVRPVFNQSQATRITFSMSLYQILAINSKQQSAELNVWVVEKWVDEFLGWNPAEYGHINSTVLPHSAIWLPDTYVYNSVMMSREETEKYTNAVVTTRFSEGKRGAQVIFMYPALYRTSCKLDIRFFPYDQQNCTLVISSWASDRDSIDYIAEFDSVNLLNFIANDEWIITSFTVSTVHRKFACCPEPWAMLEASLVVRRKPLYYIVNLVIPSAVMALVAVMGFYTPASTDNERREKLSLGIDSLLAMSIMMTMVQERIPITGDYVPFFGIFYLTTMLVIFTGSMFTALVLNVHLRRRHKQGVPPLVAKLFFQKAAPFLYMYPPTLLTELWSESGIYIPSAIGKRVTELNSDLQRTPHQASQSSRNSIKWHPRLTCVDESEHRDAKWTVHRANTIREGAAWRSAAQREAAVSNWRNAVRRISLQEGRMNNRDERNDLRPWFPSRSQRGSSARPVEVAKEEMRRHCRSALEWEFLACVLDRVLLILFTLLVVCVVGVTIAVGQLMHFTFGIASTEAQLNTTHNSL